MPLLRRVILEHLKSLLPYRKQLGRAVRRSEPRTPERMEAIARERLWHLNGMEAVNSLYEFGVGEDGISLLSFLASGIPNIYASDISRMLDLSALNTYAQYMHLPGFPADSIAHLGELGIQYAAPARTVDHLGQFCNLDLICSTAVAEHIPEAELRNIFQASFRALRDGGVFSIIVDYTDHWHHLDKRIPEYNFYRYSTHTWRFFQSRAMYQNRLRNSDIESIAGETGFSKEQQEITRADQRGLPAKRADCFRNYEIEDLLTARAAIKFRKPKP